MRQEQRKFNSQKTIQKSLHLLSYLLKESAKIVPNDEVRTKKGKLLEDNLKISASFRVSAKGV
jgi:hypothetical protein